jgi:peptidoglycan/LPS O-acetylase OafA/YrhL
VRLSDVISSRDNNFNLIRLIAAWMVLMSHSYVIVTGDPMREPLASWIGMTPGSIAVDIFFFSSGLLVTSSLVRRHDVGRFLVARAARIYPAMWAMTLLTVLFFGCAVAQTSLLEFIANDETRTYLRKNATIAWGITGNLPGIFPPGGVNGSLWTLKFEVWMYGILALIGLVSKPFASHGFRALPLLCILVAIAAMAQYLRIYLAEHVVDERYRLLSIFFLGSAAFHLRKWLMLTCGYSAR